MMIRTWHFNCECRRSRAVGLKIGLVWFVSLLVTSPLIVIELLRPDEIMSYDDLQCTITNRPFLVYGSLTAYFFPLGVMLVAYTASIRLLGRQSAGSRLRRAATVAGEDPGNGLRRSRSGRHRSSATHSGTRTPELCAYRSRRDGFASVSAAGSFRSFRDRDATCEHVQQSALSQHDRSLSPLLPTDDARLRSSGWTVSTPVIGSESASCRNVLIDHPLADSADATEQTCRNADESRQEPTSPPDRRLLGDVGAHTPIAISVNQKSRDDDRSRDAPRDTPPTVDALSLDDGSPPSLAHASGRRFRSLVQKHATTLRAIGELLSHRADDGSQVATAVAAAAAIRTVRTERKAARVIGAVFAVFVACWTPFFVLNLSLGICGPNCLEAVVGGDDLYRVFLWLGYVASTLNPIVYTVFNSTFRRTFVDLLTCRRPCSRRQPYMTSRLARRRHDFSL